MQIITFLRHGPLKKPFDDYSKLSLKQINSLALQIISPDIDHKKSEIIIKKHIIRQKHNYKNICHIISSPSNRAQQTATIISKLLHQPLNIHTNPLLKEIQFQPNKLLDAQEYKQNGLQKIRNNLFQAILAKNNLENLDHILQRIEKLTSILKLNKHQHILCITHGFFMRFLQLYYLNHKKTSNSIELQDLSSAINYPHLQGFDITI